MDNFLINLINVIFPDPKLNGFYCLKASDYAYVYLIVILSSLVILLFQKLTKKQVITIERKKRSLFYTFMSAVFIIVVLQTLIHVYYYYKFSALASIDMKERKEAIFGFPYIFAVHSQQALPEGCRATLVTDVDIEQESWMTDHRVLAYFLYPINIRAYDKSLEADCIVYYDKKGAMDLIPDDFVVKYKLDEKNILAVRRGK